MLELNKNDLQSNIVVTLELATKSFFIFKFTHVLTKDVVTFVAASDISQYPYRYNEFIINTIDLFGSKHDGEWHYIVFQSDTADITNQTDPLEYGKMMLSENTKFNYIQYEDTPITYKSYGS